MLRKQYDNPHTHTRTHGALDIHGQSYHIAVLYMVSPTTNPVSTYAGSRFILGKIRCPRLEVDTGGDDMNGAVLVRARSHIEDHGEAGGYKGGGREGLDKALRRVPGGAGGGEPPRLDLSLVNKVLLALWQEGEVEPV